MTTELPGLYPSVIKEDPDSTYTNYRATVGSGVDSFYEYLLKEWIILDGKDDLYRDMFLLAVDSIQKYMVSRPSTGSQEFAILGAVSSKDKSINPQMGHLVMSTHLVFFWKGPIIWLVFFLICISMYILFRHASWAVHWPWAPATLIGHRI